MGSTSLPALCRNTAAKYPVNPCLASFKVIAARLGGSAMRVHSRKAAGMGAVAALGCCLGACSSDFGINLPHADVFSGPTWLSYSGHKEEFSLGPPGPQELVDGDGRCAAAVAAQSSDQGGLAQGGIALQMTECDVVRRAGAPERVELGRTPAGDRAAELTYTRGPRAGIYRFAGGRLFSIERIPEALPSAQSKTAQTKKRP